MSRALLPLVAAVVCLASFPLVGADHPIKDVTFDHKGGNEWWVQLQLGGDDRQWGTPSVRDTNGEWKPMTRPSWAPNDRFYVLSYHVEPGNLVQFRVENPGDIVVSCWYAHPSGEEKCDGSEDLRATFRPLPEPNRLRVAVEGATRPLSSVAFDIGGGYVQMVKLADGTYGYDAYVPQGLKVQFVAFSGSGTRDTDSYASPCYAWPSTTPVACDSGYGGFASWPYSWDGDNRNLAVKVRGDAGDPPAKVEVRYDGGEFMPLRYSHTEHYDIWYHNAAPAEGKHVAQFRVISGSGAVACQNDGHVWPRPDPASGEEFSIGEYDSPVFMHMKGNEHWVQTNVFAEFATLYAVEAQVNGGAWTPLQKQTWCDWSRAMSAPAGSTVRFRTFTSNLSAHVTDPISWPPTTSGPLPTRYMHQEQPPAQGFDATFTNVKGNEWWIQANVAATGGTLAKVEVSLNGGAWKPLANKGWGWAASYHAPQGTIVQIRAVSTTGAADSGGCFQWTRAVAATCGGATPPPPPSGSWDATFSGVKGNNWWVQVDVSATGGTLAGADARVNGGAWTALTKQSWGSWAKSFNVPTGSTVEFRARATDGASETSAGYKWPPA